MKQFFYIVVGGIVAVAVGISLVLLVKSLAKIAGPYLADFRAPSFASVADAVITQPKDGTEISGLTRKVRYSASEEEELMTAVTLSLPNNTVKGISANAYIVKNLNTGVVVAKANTDKILPIASLTKLVTAVVAKKNIKSDTKIKLSKNVISTYGNTGQFKIGETLRAEDLLYPLLIVSSNDAAEALAENYGRQKFILAMNDFAQSIGAYKTNFADASGLSPDNRSTVDDMVMILNWLRINEPDLIAITQMKTKTIRSHTWTNPTHFLSWSTYRGGKNGYTDEANRTAATLFQLGKDKDLYSVVILGSTVRDDDIIKLLGKVK